MKETLALLLGYIRNQKEIIGQILEDLKKKKTPLNKEETVYLGYLLHNLYCAFEDFFQEVARSFENKIDDPSKYHRELLKRMYIEIPHIRPKVLSKESYQVLDELRGFRHIFRHSYDYELSPSKVEELRDRVVTKWESIGRDLETFEDFLEQSLGD